MPALSPGPDPKGLLEFSVVYTDRALNHMSAKFRQIMLDISSKLKAIYKADAVAIVPGGGTYAMEAVARQFAANRRCAIIKNGYFSYRWEQILQTGAIARDVLTLTARQLSKDKLSPFAPVPIEEAIAALKAEKPDILFAPHVETAAGIMLPEDYLRRLANAVHEYGGLFALDCIASGCMWIDMEKTGIDILISAPQKGWSSPPCAGLVMMSAEARDALESTKSDSFACDLAKWLDIMRAYENGGHAYHATMPTDALVVFRDAVAETESFGLEKARQRQQELGVRMRALLTEAGFPSVAAAGFEAPCVIVSYTRDPQISSGARFAEEGVQIAAGVPLMCGEADNFQTFRIGLFGLDKLADIDGTVSNFETVLRKIASSS